MCAHELAGKKPPRDLLVDIPRLISDYYSIVPDASDPAQCVAFGTSGHRGVSSRASFNEAHIAAITQAVCEYRASAGTTGPLYLGVDTHALSEPARRTALEVLAAHGVTAMIQAGGGFTPTPVISHAILKYNRGRSEGLSDGIVVTPSHNPPDNGGFKYNPPHGGPADTAETRAIQDRANELLALGPVAVRRIPYGRALKANTTVMYDYVEPYVSGLAQALDMEAIREAAPAIGVDPLGGSGVAYWEPIAERYGLNLTLVNNIVEPDFRHMPVDKDGKIRMDCSSPWAMTGLIELKDRFDVAFGNDPDNDRHGIVTRAGLMNPNHYLASAVWYLYQHRPDWPAGCKVGKTLVTSAMLDRVAKALGREIAEVPVGFKWFVQGLLTGECGFGGEESAGASFLRKDGTAWSTDKDGIIMDLLAAEILAVTGKDPQQLYLELAERFGDPVYERLEAPATPEQKAAFKSLTPEQAGAESLAGEPVLATLTRAPANDAALGGLKVVTENGWFAARPSGTEDIYKIYTESFLGADHLKRIQTEAKEIVAGAFQAAGL